MISLSPCSPWVPRGEEIPFLHHKLPLAFLRALRASVVNTAFAFLRALRATSAAGGECKIQDQNMARYRRFSGAVFQQSRQGRGMEGSRSFLLEKSLELDG